LSFSALCSDVYSYPYRRMFPQLSLFNNSATIVFAAPSDILSNYSSSRRERHIRAGQGHTAYATVSSKNVMFYVYNNIIDSNISYIICKILHCK